jgi:coproporphyrinogen III oxidase-like Fe-S oxidoreductase
MSAAAVAELAAGSPYRHYVYAYPHKTAYRPLRPPVPLPEVWAGERRDALFLYLHVPFCEMRCGFCNLFTQSLPAAELPGAYPAALGRQAAVVRDVLGDGTEYAQAAVGGGTPTFLDPGQLDRLFDIAEGVLGARLGTIPMSVETSPATATADRLRVLRERGATRVSIGVQSFLEAENRQVGRPQGRAEVERALTAIRAAGMPVVNIDLMYGIQGQTRATWRASLDAALSHRPEELYLYPLYVRPLTGLGRRQSRSRSTRSSAQLSWTPWDEQRMRLYRDGREHLLAAGYEQVSMRMFRLPAPGSRVAGPAYCCQDDGMVGLGSGARSYTTALHYSFDYAVGSASVKSIVADFLERSAHGFTTAEIGFWLDGDEQRRRWLLKSLLRIEGVDFPAYRRRFGTGLIDDFPELERLGELGWVEGMGSDGRLRPTVEGLAFSDTIGPWLFSDGVRKAMDAWELR